MRCQGIENDPNLRRFHRVNGGGENQVINALDDLLHNELLEIVFRQVRACNLVSSADAFPRLESLVQYQYQPIWRETTVQLCGGDVTFAFLQLQLAPELKELQIGLGQLSPEATNAIREYDGSVPLIPNLRIRLSVLGVELGAFVLQKFGRDMKYLDLDLRLGPHEPPRCNEPVILSLTQFSKLERLAIRIDNVNDLVTLGQICKHRIKPIEIDIRSLRVSDGVAAGPSPDAGKIAGIFLISKTKDIMILRLPSSFNIHVRSAAFRCTKVTTLACDVLSIPAVKALTHLQSLHLYIPHEPLSREDVLQLVTLSNNDNNCFSKIRNVRFINRCGADPTRPLASNEATTLLVVRMFILCNKADSIILEWALPDIRNSYCNWMDEVLKSNHVKLRDLRLGGNLLSAKHLRLLPATCPNLEILDIRVHPRTIWLGNRSTFTTTTSGIVGIKTAMQLVQSALPKLTILFDDDAENYYDWNFYRNSSLGNNREGTVQVRYYAEGNIECGVTLRSINKLFAHMMTFKSWVNAPFRFSTKTPVDEEFWQCATVDSALWPTQSFCEVLREAPALGLVDYRSRECLPPPGRRTLYWMKELAHGPTKIQGLRIQAGLVARDMWYLMTDVIRRVGSFLRRLELDFRCLEDREWRNVLCALSRTPNITEFALRGSFDDETPVFHWLYGSLPSVQRLDLRDCQVFKPEHSAAFVKSFQTLLEQVHGNLSALALPTLPELDSADALRLVAQMTHLREIAVHVSQLWSIRSFKSLVILIVYGDKTPSENQRLASGLVSSMRELSDVFHNLVSFTLPSELFVTQIVRDAILDVMPQLKKLHVIHPDGKVRTCIEGPRCNETRGVWCPSE